MHQCELFPAWWCPQRGNHDMWNLHPFRHQRASAQSKAVLQGWEEEIHGRELFPARWYPLSGNHAGQSLHTPQAPKIGAQRKAALQGQEDGIH